MASGNRDHDESVPGPSGLQETVRKSMFYGRGGEGSESDDSVDDPTYHAEISDASSDCGGDNDVNDGDDDGAGPNDSGEGVEGGEGGEEEDAGRRRRQPSKHVEKTGRRRKRNVENWGKVIAKKKRNLGEAYVSYATKKPMEARKLGPACSDGCFEKVGRQNVDTIFSEFWKIGDYNLQNSYLQSLIRNAPIKRKRTTAEVSSRTTNYHYHVLVNHAEFRVCKKGFLSIYGIGKKKLEVLIKKKKESPNGTPLLDQRGNKPSPRAINGPKLARVHEHIQSLPVTSSHYSRATTPHRRYLEAGTSIGDLYIDYVLFMDKKYPGQDMVSQRFYHDVFTRDYNIVFKPPKTDVCSTCEKLEIRIANGRAEEADVSAIQDQLRQHKEKAQVPRQLLQEAEAAPIAADDDDLRVIAMDLQQTLPCPRLRASVAYYKRKLWVYNFCIYDISKQDASMFVWDESIAYRGSDEVSSCLVKWLKIKQDEGHDFGTLRVFCDNCAGQNKNLYVILMALQQIHLRRLIRVEFVFLKPGHSYMPCDRAFGNIEKKIRNTKSLTSPKEYMDIIRNAVTRKFTVIPMVRDDFYNVKEMEKLITNRHTPGFATACQLVVDIKFPEGFYIKNNYDYQDTNDNITTSRLMKGRARYTREKFNLADVALNLKYKHDRLITAEKCKDLRSMLTLLDSSSKEWLQNLLQQQDELRNQGTATSTQPADDNLEEEDPEDNDILDYVPVPVPQPGSNAQPRSKAQPRRR